LDISDLLQKQQPAAAVCFVVRARISLLVLIRCLRVLTMSGSHSLLVIILDVSPLAWGERDLKRTAMDKARSAQGKRSVGPAILEEVLEALQAFASAACCLEREAGLIIMGVADSEIAVLYPRKDVLAEWLEHPDSYQPNRHVLAANLASGVADLVARAAAQATKGTAFRQAAIGAAFSRALCLINRFLVAAKSTVGLSALSENRFLQRAADDDGVVALMGNKKKNQKSASSAWSPRILIVQASEDRGPDYNAVVRLCQTPKHP
jgi:hypothetical protein